ncbi:hypothetical protein D3C79_876970 [compost metagenome]
MLDACLGLVVRVACVEENQLQVFRADRHGAHDASQGDVFCISLVILEHQCVSACAVAAEMNDGWFKFIHGLEHVHGSHSPAGVKLKHVSMCRGSDLLTNQASFFVQQKSVALVATGVGCKEED